MDNSRNMILAIVLSAMVLFGWSFIAEQVAPTATEPSTEIVDGEQVVLPNPDAETPRELREISDVLDETRGQRVGIDTPRLSGSINLRGARIDDLLMLDYNETIEEGSPPVRLLSPEDTAHAAYAHFGWTAEDIDVPDGNTVWRADGDTLAPESPVTLTWTNGGGQRFEIILEVDENYLFTVKQRLANLGDGPVSAQSYSQLLRTGESPDPDSWLIHTGPTAYSNTDLIHIDFDDVRDAGQAGERFAVSNGWLGFNDKYWLAALAPDNALNADAAFTPLSQDRYQAVFTNPATIVQGGRASAITTQFFAGAKEVLLLEEYDEERNFNEIDRSVDWGWFYWFELPVFYLLHWLFMAIGNFGVAIIALTFIVRLLMFPIAQKQFSSMATMRALQPKMKEIQERYKDDKPKMQQEILALYQKEKANPFAGCLPIFLQIPIFFALYKVLMLSVEMRHEPFVGWLRDLSAPDPLTPVNLFGLLDFTPPQFLAIGILPILLGITMYLQFKLNPAQMDPTQQKIFEFMPWIFMFIMAPFAAGLQLYWVTSNILTIAQQKWLYSRDPRLQEQAKAAAKAT